MKGGAMDQHTIAINLAVAEAHCGSEAVGRVEEAVALYADDIVWEAPSRQLRLQGNEVVAAKYRRSFVRPRISSGIASTVLPPRIGWWTTVWSALRSPQKGLSPSPSEHAVRCA
jgi:hypothetical protein